MKDVLDMVNLVADLHSMRNALDTCDIIFRGRPSWCGLIGGQPYRHVIQTGSAKESWQKGQPSSADP